MIAKTFGRTVSIGRLGNGLSWVDAATDWTVRGFLRALSAVVSVEYQASALFRKPRGVLWQKASVREAFSETASEVQLEDVFQDFPELDTLAVNLKLQQRPLKDSSRPSQVPSDRSRPEKQTTMPASLCGVPLLEQLFRQNMDDPHSKNRFLHRVLTHEAVLYRGFIERKRRVRRLSKYMDRTRKLEAETVNRPWVLELSKMLRSHAFSFVPEQYQSFQLRSGKPVRLGVPSSRDEIVLDAMRLVLDAVFEPRFSEFSFGFRPGRGRQLALKSLKSHVGGMEFYIACDLSSCIQQLRGFEFVRAVRAYVDDPFFERLLYKALDVGYVNTYGLKTESFVSVPREMGIAPVLLNVHLDAFDSWMETYRSAYSDYQNPLRWATVEHSTPPSKRRLRFVRCGTSIFVGLRGTSAEAHAVARDVKQKLHDLKMDPGFLHVRLFHAYDHRTVDQRAMFLGYHVSREIVEANVPESVKEECDLRTRPLLNVPTVSLREACLENGFISLSKRGTWIPFGNGHITHWPVEHIVRYFDRLTEGLLEFYALADNFQQLNWFVYILKRSCNLTVGRKLKLRSMRKVFNKYGRDLEVRDGDTVVANIPDRTLSVRPIVKDFYPELTPYLRRRRFITRGTKDNEHL